MQGGGLTLLAVQLPLDNGVFERHLAEPVAPEGDAFWHVLGNTDALQVLQVPGVDATQFADDAAVGTTWLALHGVEGGAAEHRLRAAGENEVASPLPTQGAEQHFNAPAAFSRLYVIPAAEDNLRRDRSKQCIRRATSLSARNSVDTSH